MACSYLYSSNFSSSSNIYNLRISLHRLHFPVSKKFILRILPDGLPITTAFQSLWPPEPPLTNFSMTLLRRISARTPSGMTCTLFHRKRTMSSSKVRRSNMPATIAVLICAPMARVMVPETAVAAAARKKPRLCATKKLAQTRGKEE